MFKSTWLSIKTNIKKKALQSTHITQLSICDLLIPKRWLLSKKRKEKKETEIGPTLTR